MKKKPNDSARAAPSICELTSCVPGKGTHFTVSSELLRSGRRVTVTRMKLLNELDQLIAAGSASYLIESE